MRSKDRISENNPPPNTSGKSKAQTTNGNPNIPQTPSISPAPPTKCHYEINDNKKKYWWDKLKPFVEIGGVILLAVYTGYTIKQVHVSQRSSRPFVGIDGFSIGHGFKDKDGKIITVASGSPEATALHIQANIRNFGPLPAINFACAWKIFLDGVEQPEIGISHSPETLNPTGVVNLTAGIPDPRYREIMNHSKVLTLNIAISYDGPEGHYQECSVGRYEPSVNAFEKSGPCPP